MKAIVYRSYGAPLELAELPEPKLSQNAVRIRAVAAGVNNADLVLHAGFGDSIMDAWFPVVPGWDVAGVVEAVGAGVSEFRPGDEVLGYVRDEILHHGAYAEKVAAPVEAFVRKPPGMSWHAAAALPLAALTAHRAIVHALAVKEGETLLIHGAAGGVGSLAAQLAVSRGARVLANDRPAQQHYLASIGVQPLDTTLPVADAVRIAAPTGVDAVLDCVGKGLLASTPLIGTPQVSACSIVEPHAGASLVFARRDPCVLNAMVALVMDGSLVLRVGRVFPLAQAAQAHRLVSEGRAEGKVVLEFH